MIEYDQNRAGASIIFGGPKDTSVLGATSLDALGYQADPVTKKLKPVEPLMI